MILKTRPVALATGTLAAVALGLLVWQLARSPARQAEPTAIRDSGLVSPAAPPRQAVPPSPPAPALASASASVPIQTPAAASAVSPDRPVPLPAARAPAGPPAPVPVAIKHRVAPTSADQPPILPHEVNSAIAKALGPKAVARFLYLDPLARRFVASVDKLGRQPAPRDLWLLQPAPGAMKLLPSRSQPDTALIARANSQRYARFVRWVDSTDTARLLQLYARLYPLLQQSYVELGHPEGYFNDRLIEVIDLMLATPAARPPLRVQKRPDEANGATPKPRYEFDDPALESLATGQKILLRMGPEHAARLKLKLKALRQGLLKLARPVGRR